MAETLTVNARELLPWTPDIDPRRRASAGIITGTNFSDEIDGPRSNFAFEFVNYNHWDGANRAKITELRIGDDTAYGTPTGVWLINQGTGIAELLLAVTTTKPLWPWTVAYVGAKYYFAQYDIGLWSWDPVDRVLTHVIVPTIGDAVRNIADGFGRLIYMGAERVGVSALDDGEDLEPSVTTGAHQQTLALVGGTAWAIGIVPDGYLVYLSNGIMKGTFVQAAFVFSYKKLTNAVKVFSPNAVLYVPLFGTISIDANGLQIVPYAQATSVPEAWDVEKSDYIKQNILNFLNQNLIGTIGIHFSIAAQKIFISFSDNTREGLMLTTFVYSMDSKRWGSFNQQHTGIFETLDPTNAIFSCSYMGTDGFMRAFVDTDYSEDVPPSPFVIHDFLYRPSQEEPEVVVVGDGAGNFVHVCVTYINGSDTIPTAYSAYTQSGLYYINWEPYSDTMNSAADDPDADVSGDPIIVGTYINMDVSGVVEIIALPYELPTIGLNSVLKIGPFRFSAQTASDETSCVSSLILGLAEATNFIISEDWNFLVGNEDWNTENGSEDYGTGFSVPNSFDLVLQDTDDGISPIFTGNEDLPVFNDYGASLSYAPMGYSSIYHNLTLSAIDPGQSFALKFVDFTGQLTGRQLNR